jgi:hypothetical protein
MNQKSQQSQQFQQAKLKLDISAPSYVPRILKNDEERQSHGSSSRGSSFNPFERNLFEEKENIMNFQNFGDLRIFSELKQEEKVVCEVDGKNISRSNKYFN